MEKEITFTVLIVSLIALAGLFSLNSTTGNLTYDDGYYSLKVSTNGNGYVSSYPSGIECGYACSETYSQGTTITLTAKSLGDNFNSWNGACSGSSPTCTLTLDSDKTVSASFGSAQHEQPKTPAPKEEINYYQRQQPQSSDYRTKIIVPAYNDHPSACDDYPTMPGCPGEGTNIVPIIPQPSIPDVTMTGFEPRTGYERTAVYIKGTNLRYVSRVYFGGELVEGFSVSPDGKELQTIVPQGAETGRITLVLTSGGTEESSQDFVVWTGKCSNPDVTKAFNQLNKLPQGNRNSGECDITRYLRAYSNYKELRNAIQKIVGFNKLPSPKIKHFNPSVALPGQEISIIGELFDIYVDEIKFNGKNTPYKFIDSKEVKITIPQETVFGEHEITIISDIHGSGSAKIKIIPLPAIYDFNPKNVWSDEEITIIGQNFYEPVEISFYNTNTKKEILTKNFKAESLQQIKVNAPQTAGEYIITIKGKNSYVRTQTVLKVESKPSHPEITSIEPENGMLGNNAIIYGKNLKSINSITLNGHSINYQKDDSDTQKTIYVNWGINHGLVKVKNPSGTVQAQLISNKNPVTKLITGKEETCFGGVGKGCYGSEDNKEEWSWGSQKIIAPVGCSNEVNGQRNCWVVPGSIKHDNCCARYPSGKMCGGPGKDGQPAGDNNHDGNCVTEWDAAFWDVFWWRAFVATFDATKSTDLTPKQSNRYTLKDNNGNAIPSETAETLRLCAPAGHELREQFDEGFCCSGSATNKKCNGGRGVQALPITDKIVRTEQGADLSTIPTPLAPGEQPKPKITEYTLEITGGYSGSVKTEDEKITNCRNQNICKTTYPSNTQVTIIATPDFADYENSGWYGNCLGTPKDQNCVLTMNADKKVTVNFFKKPEPTQHSEYTLEIIGGYSGSVKTEDSKIINCRNQNVCTTTYPINTQVNIIATPDFSDYENSGWYGDCSGTPKDQNCVLTMSADKKVIANFFKKQEQITLSKEFKLEVTGSFSGSVKTEDGKITNCRNLNTCSAIYPSGSQIKLIATPDMSDYENSGWYGDCLGTPKDQNCVLTMSANKKAVVSFFKKQEPPKEEPKPRPVRGRPIGDVCRGRRYCQRPVRG